MYFKLVHVNTIFNFLKKKSITVKILKTSPQFLFCFRKKIVFSSTQNNKANTIWSWCY